MALANWSLGNGVLVPGGLPYFAACPTSYVADSIYIANPAVPSGRTRMEWRPALGIYVPAALEPIAAIWRGASPVALVTPGVTSLTQIYQGAVIPDAVIPDGLAFEVAGSLIAKNSSGVSGCLLGLAICGAVPTGTNTTSYHVGRSVTPDAGGAGVASAQYIGVRSGSTFRCGSGDNRSPYLFGVGPFASGNNRLYAMALPSKTDDQIQFDGCTAISLGSL